MAKYLWIYEGGDESRLVIDADGNVVLCEECPCTGTATSSVVKVVCNQCPDGYGPSGYSIAISGMSNNGCTDCANFNGTFAVDRATDCFGQIVVPGNVCATTAFISWQLVDIPADGWYIQVRLRWTRGGSDNLVYYRGTYASTVQCWSLNNAALAYHSSIINTGGCAGYDSLSVAVTAY